MLKLSVRLDVHESSRARLLALQGRFSQACVATYQIARAQNCFGRVALHHIAYKTIRDTFSELGAQLVSNAIYVVSAASKARGDALNEGAFSDAMPVVLDRRTLSLTNNQLSIFTLEGRLRINILVPNKLESALRQMPLKEALLERRGEDFSLTFFFKYADEQVAA